jgi:4-amino-4-deoxy-L-arabinose transferase-like glycosyltransferase
MTHSDRVAFGGALTAVERVVDRLAASRAAAAGAIVLVALVCFLPGFASIRPIDRDETRLALAAEQMVARGDFGHIEILGRDPRFAAPGMVWLEALSAALFGGAPDAPIWVYRLPSLLGAVAAALLTWWMALAFGRPRAALLAGLFIAANIVLAGEARTARVDAALLAVIVLAEGALARIWLPPGDRPERIMVLVFWVATGIGILLKGPIAPLALALTIAVLALDGRRPALFSRLKPGWGVALVLLIVLPWIIAALGGTAPEKGVLDLLARLGGATDPRAPPGTYALVTFAIMWPLASFFVLALPWAFDRVRSQTIRFGLAAAVPFGLVAELLPLKLPHFLLPAFPAAALIAATAIDAGGVAVKGWASRFFAIGPILWPLVVAVGTPLVLYEIGEPMPLGTLVLLVASLSVGAVAWHGLRCNRPVAAAGLSVVSAALMYFGLFAGLLPSLATIQISDRLMTGSRQTPTCSDPEYAASGYVEPSLVLLAGDRVRFLDGADAANFLDRGGCRIAFVEARQLSSFRQRAEDLGLDVDDQGGVSGFNLGNGRWVRLRLFTTRDAP